MLQNAQHIPHAWDKSRGIVDADYEDPEILEELKKQVASDPAKTLTDGT